METNEDYEYLVQDGTVYYRKRGTVNWSAGLVSDAALGANRRVFQYFSERIAELEAANSKLHDELHAIKYEIMGGEDAPGSACAVTLDDIKKEIERKLEAALPQWQPIETAPKDGTVILAALRYRDGEPNEPMTIRWHESWGEWVMSGCLIGIQNSAKDDENVDPTHWMPLPQPPGE